MGRTNYHIHTKYCDGSASCAEMAAAAFNAGMESIGFSSHFTTTYPDDCGIEKALIPDYLNDIQAEKRKYQPLGMEILTGFEADYYMDTGDINPDMKRIRLGLDYIIGSIHTMGFREDGEMGIIDWKEDQFEESVCQIYGDSLGFVKAYYQCIGDMAESVRPDIIGHLDLLKKSELVLKRNILDLDSPACTDAAFQALERIRDSGCILELNTGGIARKKNPEFLYPSEKLIRRAAELDIPMMVNGDSHSPDAINTWYPQSDALLASLGVKTVIRHGERGWKTVPLSES
ncbi:MAG: histidinol-phosphatase HisJ family protein [Eubacteriaceae bacterium]|jgi:histidinol-phosphatase (PHP family)